MTTKNAPLDSFTEHLKDAYSDLINLDHEMIALTSRLYLEPEQREFLKRHMSTAVASLIMMMEFFEES